MQDILKEAECELFDLEFVKEGHNYFLRIFIDKDGGVSIDDCEFVSRRLEKILDVEDPIEQPYILEVSSPGIERPLKKDSDYEKYKGSLVDIKLYKPINRQKIFQGELLGLADGVISIKCDDQVMSFEKSSVALCKQAFVWKGEGKSK